MRKRYIIRSTTVVSQSDGDVHRISAPDLARLHGVDLRECIVIREDEDWPRGYGPLFTEEQRQRAGLTLLTPSHSGTYGAAEEMIEDG